MYYYFIPAITGEPQGTTVFISDELRTTWVLWSDIVVHIDEYGSTNVIKNRN